MNKIIITIGGLLLLGTLAAAFINSFPADDFVPTPMPDTSATSTATSTLTQKTWIWESAVDARGTDVQPEDPTEFELTFVADGTLTSTTDCNRVGGEYATHAEVLSIGSLVSTEMYCGDDTLEEAYTGMLGLVGSHVIEGDTLKLILLKDAGTMTFSAKDPE